jgi:hypothetical protein
MSAVTMQVTFFAGKNNFICIVLRNGFKHRDNTKLAAAKYFAVSTQRRNCIQPDGVLCKTTIRNERQSSDIVCEEKRKMSIGVIARGNSSSALGAVFLSTD